MGKTKDILRKILCKKRIDEQRIPWVTYEVSREDVVCFHLSTNPLLAFTSGGRQYFFRECPPKQKRELYIKKQIDRFFTYINNNDLKKINFMQEPPIKIDFDAKVIADFYAYIETLQKDDTFIRKIGVVYQILHSNRYSVWAEEKTVSPALFDQVGLGRINAQMYDIAVYFIWYMHGVMGTLDAQTAVAGKKRYYYNAVRTMATETVAKALGVEELITPSQWCCLVIDGETRFGIASEAAPGIRALDAEGSPTGLLQRDLICLNVLDAICFQQDHGPNNYNIDLSRDHTVCAFDNDNPNTFFPFSKISWALSGCDPIVTAEGEWNRPYMDQKMAEALLDIDKTKLKAELCPYLNKLQITSLLHRLGQIQVLMKNSCLLSDSQWNGETLQKELSGDYGKTYLCGFANRNKQ